MKGSSEQTIRAVARNPRALSPRLFILNAKHTVETVTGIEVDHYMAIDFSGFEKSN
jgi:hypothetical protein